jgi:hypothetical protein
MAYSESNQVVVAFQAGDKGSILSLQERGCGGSDVERPDEPPAVLWLDCVGWGCYSVH